VFIRCSKVNIALDVCINACFKIYTGDIQLFHQSRNLARLLPMNDPQFPGLMPACKQYHYSTTLYPLDL
jgi:hypothetical protein